MLDVDEQNIGHVQQLVERIKPRLSSGERLPARVKTGADAKFLAFRKQVKSKFGLQQNLAPRKRDSALLSPKLPIRKRLFQDLISSHCRSDVLFPSIGVVTELAPHIAALHKDYEADSGPINGAERFNRMNVP